MHHALLLSFPYMRIRTIELNKAITYVSNGRHCQSILLARNTYGMDTSRTSTTTMLFESSTQSSRYSVLVHYSPRLSTSPIMLCMRNILLYTIRFLVSFCLYHISFQEYSHNVIVTTSCMYHALPTTSLKKSSKNLWKAKISIKKICIIMQYAVAKRYFYMHSPLFHDN